MTSDLHLFTLIRVIIVSSLKSYHVSECMLSFPLIQVASTTATTTTSSTQRTKHHLSLLYWSNIDLYRHFLHPKSRSSAISSELSGVTEQLTGLHNNELNSTL